MKDAEALAARTGSDTGKFAGSKLDFLWTLCIESGLIRLSEREFSIDRDGTIQWLELSAAEAMSQSIRMWLQSKKWADLCRIPEIRCGDDFPLDPAGARMRFLQKLMDWTGTSDVYPVDALISAFEEWAPDFNRPSGDYTGAEIFDSRSGEELSGREHWKAVEGRLIKYLLTHPMQWLGLAARCDEGSFQWSTGGRELLEAILQNEEQEWAEDLADGHFLQLLDGTDFLLSWHAPPRQVFRAYRVAEWKKRTREGTVFSFSRASLKRAAMHGIILGQVIEFLEDASGEEIPPEFLEALAKLSKR